LHVNRALEIAISIVTVRRDLRRTGVSSDADVELAEQQHAEAEQRVAATRKRIAEADVFVAELMSRKAVAGLPPLPSKAP
jgi:hypothetical protein